jgi:catechol 2,3-dioxygenase-like lactoylglutathione lyase family enzyme
MTPVPAQEVSHAEFAHVAVLVSDVARSAAWYHDVLGWEPVFEADQGPVLGEANGHGGPGSIAMGRIGATNVELVAMHEPPLGPWRRSERYGLMLISIRVSDVPAARARCAAFGAAIAREVAFGPTLVLVVTDPDGTEIAIVGPA